MFTLFRGWGRPGAISTFCANRLFPSFNSQGILNQNKLRFICGPLPTIILGGLPARDKIGATNSILQYNNEIYITFIKQGQFLTAVSH